MEASLQSRLVYPSSIRWSDENLIAVATGHHITIFDPARLHGPRDFILLSDSNVANIGTVDPSSLDAPSLFQFRLDRDTRSCVRSIDWSPLGFSLQGGCLLIVCGIDDSVNIFRSPFPSYQSEWVKVANLSEILFHFHQQSKFSDAEKGLVNYRESDGFLGDDSDWRTLSEKEKELINRQRSEKNLSKKNSATLLAKESKSTRKRAKLESKLESNLENESSKESSKLPPHVWSSRKDLLSLLSVCCSPLLCHNCSLSVSESETPLLTAIIATGSRSGHISIFTLQRDKRESEIKVKLLFSHSVTDSWLTAIAWENNCRNKSDHGEIHSQLVLTGSEDGSVSIWKLCGSTNGGELNQWSLKPLWTVREADGVPVSVVAMKFGRMKLRDHHGEMSVLLVSGGKAAGQLVVAAMDWSLFSEKREKIEKREKEENICNDCSLVVYQESAHCQVITGLIWNADSALLYSCSQDNQLLCWSLQSDNSLSLNSSSHSLKKMSLTSQNLPSNPLIQRNVFDTKTMSASLHNFMGISISPNKLMIASARGVSQNMLDRMYTKRTTRGGIQLHWIAGQISSNSSLTPLSSPLTPLSLTQQEWSSWGNRVNSLLNSLTTGYSPAVLWDLLHSLRLWILSSSSSSLSSNYGCLITAFFNPLSQNSSSSNTSTDIVLTTLSKQEKEEENEEREEREEKEEEKEEEREKVRVIKWLFSTMGISDSLSLILFPSDCSSLSALSLNLKLKQSEEMKQFLSSATLSTLQTLSALLRLLSCSSFSSETEEKSMADSNNTNNCSCRFLYTFLLFLEHEIRQRFFLASILLHNSLHSHSSLNLPPLKSNGCFSLSDCESELIALWVILNKETFWPCLQNSSLSLLSKLHSLSQFGSHGCINSLAEKLREREICSLCKAPVSISQTEFATCQPLSGGFSHTLPRCMRTLKSCGGESSTSAEVTVWHCTVCSRTAMVDSSHSRGSHGCFSHFLAFNLKKTLTGLLAVAVATEESSCELDLVIDTFWESEGFLRCVYCGVKLQPALSPIYLLPTVV